MEKPDKKELCPGLEDGIYSLPGGGYLVKVDGDETTFTPKDGVDAAYLQRAYKHKQLQWKILPDKYCKFFKRKAEEPVKLNLDPNWVKERLAAVDKILKGLDDNKKNK